MEALIVAPVKIYFGEALSHVQRKAVSIMNPTKKPMLFKVKTNMSPLYSVRPNCGRIMPLETSEIIITYNINEVRLSFDRKSIKHKIFVQSIVENKDMKLLPNLKDAFRLNGGDQLIYNTRLDVSFDEKPLMEMGEGRMRTRSSAPSRHKERSRKRRYLDKKVEKDESNANKPLMPWLIFGIASIVLTIGIGYYCVYINNMLADYVPF